jgi:hypothetical protein
MSLVMCRRQPEAQASKADGTQVDAHVANAAPEKTQPEAQAANTQSDVAEAEPNAATKEVVPEIHATILTPDKSEPEALAVDKLDEP